MSWAWAWPWPPVSYGTPLDWQESVYGPYYPWTYPLPNPPLLPSPLPGPPEYYPPATAPIHYVYGAPHLVQHQYPPFPHIPQYAVQPAPTFQPHGQYPPRQYQSPQYPPGYHTNGATYLPQLPPPPHQPDDGYLRDGPRSGQRRAIVDVTSHESLSENEDRPNKRARMTNADSPDVVPVAQRQGGTRRKRYSRNQQERRAKRSVEHRAREGIDHGAKSTSSQEPSPPASFESEADVERENFEFRLSSHTLVPKSVDRAPSVTVRAESADPHQLPMTESLIEDGPALKGEEVVIKVEDEDV